MRRIFATTVVLAACVAVLAQEAKDTDKAASTRKLLKVKISVDYTDDLLQNVAKDISERVKDVSKMDFPTKIDNISGASNNMKVSYTAKDKTVAEILEGIGKKYDLGYIVISGKYKTYTKYDGFVLITKGSERGFPDKK